MAPPPHLEVVKRAWKVGFRGSLVSSRKTSSGRDHNNNKHTMMPSGTTGPVRTFWTERGRGHQRGGGGWGEWLPRWLK